MAERVRVREISNDEGQRLLRIVRRSSGSVVTWRRAQMVLLSAQGMDPAAIAEVTFTSPDRVRDVLHNFNTDGFESLKPKYPGGRPPKFDLDQRAEIKKIALSRPADHRLPFSTWSEVFSTDWSFGGGQDECRFGDGADSLRAQSDAVERLPAGLEQGDRAFALGAQTADELVAGEVVRVQVAALGRRQHAGTGAVVALVGQRGQTQQGGRGV